MLLTVTISKRIVFISLLLVVSVGLGLFRYFAPRTFDCPNITMCKSTLARVDRCRAWDESFQDSYYFEGSWGTPETHICKKYLAGSIPAGWKKERCPQGLENSLICFTRSTQVSADEHENRLLAFTLDCHRGVEILSSDDLEDALKRTNELDSRGCFR